MPLTSLDRVMAYAMTLLATCPEKPKDMPQACHGPSHDMPAINPEVEATTPQRPMPGPCIAHKPKRPQPWPKGAQSASPRACKPCLCICMARAQHVVPTHLASLCCRLACLCTLANRPTPWPCPGPFCIAPWPRLSPMDWPPTA